VSLKLRVFLIGVGLAAAITLIMTAPALAGPRWPHYLAWAVLCLIGESMTTEAPGRHGTWSLSSTVALASVVLWGTAPAVWITATSTLVSEKTLLRKSWVRAVFNSSQIALTIALAGWLFDLVARSTGGLEALPPAGARWAAAVRLAPAIGSLVIGYHVINRALAGIPIAWSTGRPYLRALREDWFYTERLLNDAAAYLLSPLMVLAYNAISYLGVTLFYAPLYMIYLSDRRQLELRRAYEALRAAQERLIESELAAQIGELARTIGHDLNNVMTPISTRAQMLVRDAERGVWDNVARNAGIILEQTAVAGEMSRSLRDARLTEPKLARVDVNAVLRQAVEAVRGQPRLEGVEWSVVPGDDLPHVLADAVQIQRVLGNLFVNAAEAMNEASGLAEKRIHVESRWDRKRHRVWVVVSDTGPGIPADVLPRVFRPHFTTKKGGHGFGLSGSRQIALKHDGDLIAESPAGGGARFTLELPALPDNAAD
jgi:signal transduction histidine kinase